MISWQVSKMVQAPIFHVNGDDPDAVIHATQVALDYRQQFKKDVVIDLVCYRRRGHNEADEPSGTQPLMYAKIKDHPSSRTLYAQRLIEQGVLSEDDAKAMVETYRDDLVAGNHVANALVQEPNKSLFVDWAPYLGHEWTGNADTTFDMKRLQQLAAKMCEIPDGVDVQRQVAKIYEDRRKMQAGGMGLNWGFAETLAYATLLDQGHPIRITGQDVGRGTFSHRHAVVHNQKDGSTYVPLQNMADGQPRFTIHDSFLSEEAVLAFEYGYSTTAPNDLVIWEAQFGDFVNGAQVVVDQFISSGETKWGRLCGLTMLLPHGYEGHIVQRQVAKIYEDRRKMQAGGMGLNWGFAETLAYATLLDQGHPIRITGQDVGRGTFSHRHAVVHNQKDGSTYVPLQNMADGQPRFTIHDSFLSEEAVLAFEYGYSTTAPNDLVIWEAQFGDFVNGAQVVVDQFISSGETKWGRLCGLTMLLPHGYEGQGPEHSSARLERFLQLCAEHNMQVCVPTTPAQIFHLLRRQVIRPLRKPLVVMSPKSLLRHKEAVSSLEDLAHGKFHMVLPDQANLDADNVTRVIMCAGKVYYDLVNWRAENERDDTAIIRLEQLYPFPKEELLEVLQAYANVEDIVWCQEEPLNQGAWYSSQHHMRTVADMLKDGLGRELKFAGRPASAAPAAGYMSVHTEQQRQLVEDAFNL